MTEEGTTCVWTHTDTNRPHDRRANHDEYWKNPHEDDLWWAEGRIDDFEFCPYCGKPIERVVKV